MDFSGRTRGWLRKRDQNPLFDHSLPTLGNAHHSRTTLPRHSRSVSPRWSPFTRPLSGKSQTGISSQLDTQRHHTLRKLFDPGELTPDHHPFGFRGCLLSEDERSRQHCCRGLPGPYVTSSFPFCLSSVVSVHSAALGEVTDGDILST